MIAVSTALDAALKAAGIPIDGVSVKDPADRRTWRIDFTPAATTQQRAAGEAIKAAFDPENPAVKAAIDAKAAQTIADDRKLQAFWLFYFRDQHGKDPTAEERTAARDALAQAYQDTPD